MENLPEMLLLIAFSGTVELFFIVKIFPPYFRRGIPVYRISRRAENTPEFADIMDALENQLPRRQSFPQLVFRQVSENELAFREKSFAFKFRPHLNGITHHKLVFVPGSNKVKIIGHMNWSILLLIFLLSGLVNDGAISSRDAFSVFLLIMIVPYIWQVMICSDIMTTITNYDKRFTLD